MEACVVICRTKKVKERRGKILFINAVNEVTRERAQSFLTDEHIQRIVDAYRGFTDIEGFARVISNGEVLEKGCNLSIPLYVRTNNGNDNGEEKISLKEAVTQWQESSKKLRESMNELFIDLQTSINAKHNY